MTRGEALGRCCAHFLSARFLFPAGLWLYLAGSSLPCLTLIGSPNFGYRSVHRDLEAQIAIVTESRALQGQLHQVGRDDAVSRAEWGVAGGSGLPASLRPLRVAPATISSVRKNPSPQKPGPERSPLRGCPEKQRAL